MQFVIWQRYEKLKRKCKLNSNNIFHFAQYHYNMWSMEISLRAIYTFFHTNSLNTRANFMLTTHLRSDWYLSNDHQPHVPIGFPIGQCSSWTLLVLVNENRKERGEGGRKNEEKEIKESRKEGKKISTWHSFFNMYVLYDFRNLCSYRPPTCTWSAQLLLPCSCSYSHCQSSIHTLDPQSIFFGVK